LPEQIRAPSQVWAAFSLAESRKRSRKGGSLASTVARLTVGGPFCGFVVENLATELNYVQNCQQTPTTKPGTPSAVAVEINSARATEAGPKRRTPEARTERQLPGMPIELIGNSREHPERVGGHILIIELRAQL